MATKKSFINREKVEAVLYKWLTERVISLVEQGQWETPVELVRVTSVTAKDHDYELRAAPERSQHKRGDSRAQTRV